jgi:hypothetical protein
MRKLGLLAGLLITAAPVFAEVPVRAVTLFEAGLAEITRESREVLFISDGPILEDYDPHLVLTVSQAQVNDVLKSLRIGGEVTSAEIRLDGAAPVEDAFAHLPIGPGAIGDLAALLGAMPGVPVRVTGPAGFDPVSGRVMGVTREGCETGPCPPTLLLRTEEGMVSLALDQSRRVVIGDPSLRARVDEALEALARNGAISDRTLTIETESEGPVSLSYVVPAPVWKTAYRAETGEDGTTRLQAWAVLENVSGADWDGVRLTLSSGSPNTLQADLTTRDWRVRDPYEAENSPAPRLMQAERAETFMSLQAAPMAELAPETVTRDRGLDSRFTFPDPVDLDQGEMISLPFLSEEVPVERTLVWRGQLRDRTGNPDLVLRVENPLPIRLPAGIVTVSDATGYLGDAAFPVLVPGDAADVPFGQDQRVEVRETAAERSAERRVTVSKGAIRISERWVRTTEYRVSAPSGEAPALTVLHPEQPGWAVSGVAPAQNQDTSRPEGDRVRRFELPAGTGALRVEEERPRTEIWQISDLPRERLASLLTDRVSSADRARLERILSAMGEADRVRADLSRVAEARDRAVSDQERARRMMGSAPSGSDMEGRFRTSVLELEDRIGELDAREAELTLELRAAEAALDVLFSD